MLWYIETRDGQARSAFVSVSDSGNQRHFRLQFSLFQTDVHPDEFSVFHTVNTQVMLQYGFPQISRQIEIHMGSHIHQRFLRRCTVIFYYQIVSTEPIPYIIAVGTLWKSVHVMTAFQMKMQCLFLLFNMKQLSGYTTRTTMQMMTALLIES